MKKKYIALIENVQHRATKFILNYRKDTYYKSRMIMLDLLPLESCWQIKDLSGSPAKSGPVTFGK